MTTDPPADPSSRALGESLAALAAQVADLRSQIGALNERLDQAGLHAGLNLAAPQTARGLRQMVLNATPLPALPEAPAPGPTALSCTKKSVFLALYRAHPDYGDRSRASRVAAELAPQAGLQPGTARSYMYAELDGRKP